MRSWSSALLLLTKPRPPRSPPFPYTTLFRSNVVVAPGASVVVQKSDTRLKPPGRLIGSDRAREQTPELQSLTDRVCSIQAKQEKTDRLPRFATHLIR